MLARRISLASLVATGVVAVASAQNPAPPPPPPTVNYTGLSKEQKAIVQGFAKLPEKYNKPASKVFYPAGKTDDRKAGERYLKPGHPGPVPRPSPAAYIRYINAENQDLLPTVQPPDGIELKLITWTGGGPTSCQNRAIVGTDNGGLLHIRIFEGYDPTSYFETNDGGMLHLKTVDASGKVIKDELESNLTEIRKIAIRTLKEQLPGLLPPQHVLTDAEKGLVFRKVTTIIDKTPTGKTSPGFDLRLRSWGDGSGVPNLGTRLVILGTDNNGRLHIRIFDADGNLATDTDETKLPGTQARAIATLKQQLPGLLPPHELTNAENAQLLREVTSITGQTPSPDQVDCKPEYLPRIGSPDTLKVTYDITPEGIYPKKDPFADPPGTNLLPTVYQDARDGNGDRMENTLPSTPRDPYHLHAEPPRVTPIDPASPTDDLGLIIDRVYQIFTGTTLRGTSQGLEDLSPKKRKEYLTEHATRIKQNAEFLRFHLKWAIDIIEGNPVPGRAYSGFPLLHHSGQNRIKRVMPVFGTNGDVVGGEVEVNQVWYDQRIESDTMFFDFKGWYDPPGSTLQPIPTDVRWTITYKVNVLTRGSDDFSTTTMFFDAPAAAKESLAQVNPPASGPSGAIHQGQDPASGLLCNTDPAPPGHGKLIPKAPPPPQLPHVSMDQTFFPMDAGTRTIVKIKMPPVKYYNLTYTWGWRIHPPRAQAIENAHKAVAVVGDCVTEPPKYLVDFEMDVFGYLIRLMSWGDGSKVPTGHDLQLFRGDGSGVPASSRVPASSNNLVIVGIDNNGRLHIRIFDAAGNRVTDTDETKVPDTQAGAVKSLKQQLLGLFPPHVLTSAEKAQLIGAATSIVGHPSSDLNKLVIVGIDNTGQLQIRTFDGAGKATDTDVSKLPNAPAGAIAALKQRIPGLLPSHVLTSTELNQLQRDLTSILGQPLAQTVLGTKYKHPIDAISDLAPAKRMLRSFKGSLAVVEDALKGLDVESMPWGDGTRVPTSGKKNVVIVGTDDQGHLHVRVFDRDGRRVADTDESKLPRGQEQAVTNLKKQLADPSRSRAMIDGEKASILRGVASIVDLTNVEVEGFYNCLCRIEEARDAYLDWKDRTHLPSGLRPDPRSDLTLFYANNTIYGEMYDGAFVDLAKWRKRPTDLRVTLINGDYFDHGYLNVDFGGNRGWENQFKSSIAVAGIGSFFTFGRFHWWMNTFNGGITVPAAKGFKGVREINTGELPEVVVPGVHRVWIQFNHDPGRRLRFYQFDPEHHDVNIFSIH